MKLLALLLSASVHVVLAKRDVAALHSSNPLQTASEHAQTASQDAQIAPQHIQTAPLTAESAEVIVSHKAQQEQAPRNSTRDKRGSSGFPFDVDVSLAGSHLTSKAAEADDSLVEFGESLVEGSSSIDASSADRKSSIPSEVAHSHEATQQQGLPKKARTKSGNLKRYFGMSLAEVNEVQSNHADDDVLKWIVLIALLLIILFIVYRACCPPRSTPAKSQIHFHVEDHHDDHHHEEVDMFHKHEAYSLARAAQRALQVKHAVEHMQVKQPLPALEAQRSETGGTSTPGGEGEKTAPKVLKPNEWLTPEACEEIGLPPLGRLMADNLKTPPWEWTDSVNGWSRLPFPWDPLQLQMLLKEFAISTRDDPDDFSMPSKLVEQFMTGRCIWKYKSSDKREEIDRITPLMCIRIIDPQGRFLVRASRMVLKDGKLKPDERPQWPGRALGQPDDAIEEAAHLISDQCHIDKDILTIRVAESVLTEPRNCNMLRVQVRFFRHFIDAQISSEVLKDETRSKQLGLAEGGFTLSSGDQGECDKFEWWSPSKCVEKMPTGHVVHEHAKGEKVENADDDVVLVMPWNSNAVERCLRAAKVNTSKLRTMREEIAEKLESEEYHLVHNVKHEHDRSHGDPSVALVSTDGRTFFFAQRAQGEQPAGYA